MLVKTLLLLTTLATAPPPVFQSVMISAGATVDAAGYHYSYAVTNPASNNLDVGEVDIDLGNAFPASGGGGPQPCEFRQSDGSFLVTWLNCGDTFRPGQTTSDLTLQSARPPAVLDGVVEGDVWIGYIDLQPEGTDMSEEQTASLEAATTLRVPTIGPTPVQPGSFAHWDRWAADLTRAGQLGWITDATLLVTVQADVAAARQAVVARDRATAIAKLQAIMDLVQQAVPARCTSEGHALAYLNALDLKTRVAGTLPSPFESELTLAPPAATHAVGETATLTVTYRNVVDGSAIVGCPITFQVTSGPDSGLQHDVATDAQGAASLTITGKAVGVDQVIAYYVPIFPSLRTSAGAAALPPGAVQASVTWQGGPDLIVSTFTPPLLKSAPGRSFVVYETTANEGNLPAGASVTRYFLSAAWPVDPATATVVGQRSVPALAPGQESRVEALELTVPAGLQSSLYHLAACADADQAVVESNETNNCTTTNLAATMGVVGAERVNLPPDCSKARAVPDLLWPPDHRLVPITIAGVTDPDGDPVRVTVTGITQDEPTNGLGDGDTSPDGAGVGTAQPQVRAERSGTGNGRVYAISFRADDGKGGTCTGVVTVGVPHDQGKDANPVDDGQTYDSTR